MNVGIATVVGFLQKKGHTVEANPNTKISEEQYAILVKEFSTDTVSYTHLTLPTILLV